MNENLAALDVPGVEVIWAEEQLDSDTAGLGVVDGVPGLGVEVVGKADPDAAASGTEATSGVLETEGRDEEQTQLLFFLAGGSSPP